MSLVNKDDFFSIGFDFVMTDIPLLYDVYINSSSLENKERFVRIFPTGGILEKADLERFRKKYHQLYVQEKQRNYYLRSLVKNDNVSNEKKTEIIKDSAIHYLDSIFDKDKVFNNEMLGEAIEGCRDSVETMVEVVQDYNVNEIQELIANLSFHDFYTYDHSINVSMYNISIFKTMKPSSTKQELVLAGIGGLLHDLGKMNIPTHIINNPGKLTDEEFDIIKTHPDNGRTLVEEHVKHFEGLDLEVIKKIIVEHHENYNGTGYPNKIEGKDIHVFARITALSDFFDAITTKRSYHKVLSTDEAISVMSKSAGKKLDPDLFEILAKNVRKLVTSGNPKLMLPDSFDPCRPYNELPFVAPKTNAQLDFFKKEGNEKNFGKVKLGTAKIKK